MTALYHWLKLWNEAPDDPKWLAVAEMAGSSRPVVWYAFSKALTHANQNESRGSIAGLQLQVIASWCGVPLDEVKRVFQAFRELGLLIGDRIAKWTKRQVEKLAKPRSVGAERQARWRAKQADAARQGAFEFESSAPVTPASEALFSGVTSATEEEERERYSDSPSGESAAVAADPPPPDAIKSLFDRGLRCLTEANVPERRSRAVLGQWRRDAGDAAVLAAIAACEEEQPSEPLAFIAACLGRPRAGRTSEPEILTITPDGARYVEPERNNGRPLSAHRAQSAAFAEVVAILERNNDLSRGGPDLRVA